MEPYSETMEALVAELLKGLAPDADLTGGYLEQLHQLSRAIGKILRGTEEPSLTPEQEQLVRQAVGQLDPKNGDAELDGLEMLRRLHVAIDKELFKWDSSIVQPIGWSGDAQVAIGAQDYEDDETMPAEQWNRRLREV